jgi:hypothetical protein
LRRIAKITALSALLAFIAANSIYQFVQSRGVEFWATRPQLIWNCILLALAAGVLIKTMYRPGAWAVGKRLTRPVRLVVLTWSLAVVLCIALVPVDDTSGPMFVSLGTLLSLPVVVIGVGLALSAGCRMNNLLLLAAAVAPFVAFAAFAFAMLVWEPVDLVVKFEVITWGLRVVQCILGVVAIGLVALSMRGWLAFFRERGPT